VLPEVLSTDEVHILATRMRCPSCLVFLQDIPVDLSDGVRTGLSLRK
jgi:hypothetical protein